MRGGRASALHGAVGEGLSEVTFDSRWEGNKGRALWISGESLPDRGSSKCRSPEAGLLGVLEEQCGGLTCGLLVVPPGGGSSVKHSAAYLRGYWRMT